MSTSEGESGVMFMKRVFALNTLVFLLTLASLVTAQSPQFKKMTFHVLEVRQSDAEGWCWTGTCSPTKIEVSGFTKENRQTISYNLECIEVIQMPQTGAASSICVHVQAGQDYPARIYPTAVMFGEYQHVAGVLVLYNIVSQREEH